MNTNFRAGSSAATAPVVLLVDDNRDDRELAMLAIRQLPQRLEVVEAADGLEALQILRAEPVPGASGGGGGRRPALVLLDVSMPRLDGKQLLRQIREDPRHAGLPVVMFTTSAAPWDVDECYAAGCNVYLVKPFTGEELVRVLGELFRVFLEYAELPSR